MKAGRRRRSLGSASPTSFSSAEITPGRVERALFSASTAWAFACPASSTGSATGLTPSATLTNVTVGTQTCTGSGTNTLKSVSAGTAGTTVLTQNPTMSGSVGVYGTPGTPTSSAKASTAQPCTN